MSVRGDVVILGGGVIGLTTAYFLAREGVRVVVCDQGHVGQEASWAGAGILSPSSPEAATEPLDRLRALSGQLFPSLSDELHAQTGIDNGFSRCGGLVWEGIGDTDEHEWHGPGVPHEELDEGRTLEPALAANLGPALHLPTMAQVRNPRHLQALRAACLGTGRVVLEEERPVLSLDCRGGRVVGAVTASGTVHGEAFLVAAGAWTDRLLAPLGVDLGIEPVRGQIALLNPGRPLLRRILAWGSCYLVPRGDGRVLVGSTEEHAGFEKRNTAEAIQALLELAQRLVPALGDATLESCWSGLRPGRSHPALGPVQGFGNLWVAAGHFRAGIQLSPGSAAVMRDLILGRPPALPVDMFRAEPRHVERAVT